MSIPDGEYDIDLTQLLEASSSQSSGSFAIRYGFIPESMDQASPLKLYQTEKECILEAKSTDTSSKTPIIFEGPPQRHRKLANPALESYYLSYTPNKTTVELRRLSATIRVNKSRNARQWEEKISQWNDNSLEVIIGDLDFDELEAELRPKPDEPVPKPASLTKQQTPIPKQQPRPKPKASVKPTPKPEAKRVPQKAPSPRAAKAPPPAAKVEDDDDFRDLEEELEEVLGEDEASDSDGDLFAPIVINVDDGPSQKSNAYESYTKSQSKPMSLRAFYGGNDDGSSSEAE